MLRPPPIRLSTFCWRPDCPKSAGLGGLARQRLHRVASGRRYPPTCLCRCPSLVIVHVRLLAGLAAGERLPLIVRPQIDALLVATVAPGGFCRCVYRLSASRRCSAPSLRAPLSRRLAALSRLALPPCAPVAPYGCCGSRALRFLRCAPGWWPCSLSVGIESCGAGRACCCTAC